MRLFARRAAPSGDHRRNNNAATNASADTLGDARFPAAQAPIRAATQGVRDGRDGAAEGSLFSRGKSKKKPAKKAAKKPARPSAKSGLIATLEVGSQKTVCMIARREKRGLRVIGVGHQQSLGIKSGVVVDAAAAEHSILQCVNAAEQASGQKITNVTLVLSGARPQVTPIAAKLMLQSARVNGNHLLRLAQVAQQQARQHLLSQTQMKSGARVIAQCNPVDYSVDFERAIEDPRGLFADELSGRFLAVSFQNAALRTLLSCIERCLLTVDDVVFGPFAAMTACLDRQERELGALIIDLGAGTSSYCLVAEGRPVKAGALSVGAGHITRDVSQALGVSLDMAERLKTTHGAALSFIDHPVQALLSPNGVQDVAQGRTSQAELVSYIRPRCEELFELVLDRLETASDGVLPVRSVVLVGGGAQLSGIDLLAQEIFQRPTRIAHARVSNLNGAASFATAAPTAELQDQSTAISMPERFSGPAFATVIGALMLSGSARALAASDDARGVGRVSNDDLVEARGLNGQPARVNNIPTPDQLPPARDSNVGGLGRWLKEHF